jgi:phenylalanyl-tRNA synthetase beta chain
LAAILDVPGIDKGKAGTADDRQKGIRLLRGAMEAVAETLGGRLELMASPPRVQAFDPGAHADILLEGKPAGSLGLLTAEVQRLFGLDLPVVAAELDLDLALALIPARARIATLPAFPSIERDLSLIVDEQVTWASVHTLVAGAGIDRLESAWFIGTFRGKQIGAGKKSLTFRMRFRDPARTLRHEDVDPQVSAVIALAGGTLGATLRA